MQGDDVQRDQRDGSRFRQAVNRIESAAAQLDFVRGFFDGLPGQAELAA